MWYLGLAGGLLLGAMFDSLVAALVAGVVGAIVFKIWVPGPAAKPAPAPAPAEGPNAVVALQQRIAALERRVAALEQGGAVQGEPAAVIAPKPAPAAQPLVVPRPAVASTAVVPPVVSSPPSMPAVPPVAVTQPPPPPPPRPAPPPKPPAVPLRQRLPAPIEKLIFGGNMLVKLGVLILFLGLAFLLRYTAERVTVPIELRYAGVAVIGAALLAFGWVLRRKKAVYALTLQGAGIGVFYLTALSAMKLHNLLPPEVGFAFLFAVAVLAALLAVLQNAPVLAIVAALEGFAAPVLASTGSNRPVALFTYLLVLDVGIFLVAWFRAWRVLNLIGAVGTFTLAAGWAHQYYTDDQYATVQPFLAAFFVLFSIVGLLFARRTLFDAPIDASRSLAGRASDTLKRVGRVDSALVFGVPMAAFGMQYLLMRPWEFGAAFSALAFGAFYLGLGRLVFATQPRGLALLAEAYAIVGVIFATLAIPLGFEGRWTGAAWAIEAAGMYWLGVRQQRPYARGFAFALMIGAAVQLLRDIRVIDLPDAPLLGGSLIGPLMLAGGAFAMWVQWRRAKFDQSGAKWESLAGIGLPWLGMAALTLLPYQLVTPMWAACATALLALATFVVALRFELVPLKAVVQAMQAFAVVAFVATLHGGGSGEAVLVGGAGGVLAALLTALGVLATAAWTMRQAQRAALARGFAPQWSTAQIGGSVVGVAMLHLALLLSVDLSHAAILWPLGAALVLWIALRIAHPALALLAAVVHGVAALMFVSQLGGAHGGEMHAAFAHLGFWTPLVLGLTALVGADWLRGEARHVVASRTVSTSAAPTRWINAWCAEPGWLWASLLWGVLWWFVATLGEGARVLDANGLRAYEPAMIVAVVLVSSLLASAYAARRDWPQLGRTTAATLAGFAAAAAVGVALGVVDGTTHGLTSSLSLRYLPSSALGWLAWPLALLWHLRLLKAQQRWLAPKVLELLHIGGLWLFLLLAARECQWRFARFGADDFASWPLLGWVLVPVLVLWALRSRAALHRWPLTAYRRAYLEIALLPVAAYLFVWVWATNLLSPGDAAPLPYVPLLNPLELAHGLVLVASLLWWKALPADSRWRLPTRVALRVAAVTGWALSTGMVLRAVHHYADVPWELGALFGSRLAQAALSITWAVCGVLAMVLGHRRATRTVWIGGAALLGIVVVKLFLVELADRGGLFRIVSFVGVGVLLLVVGYFAPVPPAKSAARKEEVAA